MKVNLPDYVYEFGKFSETNNRKDIKTLLLPPEGDSFHADSYTWGYWSLTPLTSLLTNGSFVSNNSAASPSQRDTIELLYSEMRHNSPTWVNFAKQMGIKSFLLRKDFVWKEKTMPTDNPLIYEETLNRSDIKLVKKFGEWEVYDFVDNSNVHKQLTVVGSLTYLLGNENDIQTISSLPSFTPGEPLFTSGGIEEDIVDDADKIYISPNCINCSQQTKYINTDLYIPLLIRGSVFYPLVDVKNKIARKKIEKKSLDERLTFYLEESLKNDLALQKGVDQKAEVSTIVLIAQDYYQSLERLKAILQEYLSSGSSSNEELIKAKDMIRTQESIFLEKAMAVLDGETTDILNQDYELMQDIKNIINVNVWQTSDTKKRFFVTSPKDGDYEVFYRFNDSSISLSDSINFYLDNKNYSVKPIVLDSGWVSFGMVSMNKGTHKLEVVQPNSNLYKGDETVRVTSSINGACFLTNPIKGNKNDMYRITLKHKKISGLKSFYVRIKTNNSLKPILDKTGDVLRANFYTDNYENIHFIEKDGEQFYVSICDNPTTDIVSAPSIIELSNIVIEKISTPDVVFYRSIQDKVSDIKNISINKLSQTKYALHAESNNKKYFVILNESLNPNWEIQGMKNNKFAANGFVNGWIVDGNHKDLIIKYNPQDIVKISFVISGIAVFAVILFLGISFIKKHD